MKNNKTFSERFDEKFPNHETAYQNEKDEYVWLFKKGVDVRELKQFFTSELEDIIKEIRKSKEYFVDTRQKEAVETCIQIIKNRL